MTFWAYMLHCRGGSFYVGQTDNLEYRIGQHQSGLIAGLTAEHLPVTLIWSQEFPSRHEAKDAEKRIKGWSRAKKMSLIRGDWDRISVLAKSKSSPSTSSGQTGKGEMVVQDPDLPPHPARPELVGFEEAAQRQRLSFSLRPHPQTPSKHVSAVHGSISVAPDTGLIRLEYQVENAAALKIPSPLVPERADELWRTTCLEFFVREQGREEYTEYNFSPSTQWAAYGFDGYRGGMRNAAMHDPGISGMNCGGMFILSIERGLVLPIGRLQIGLSAVIEETDGTKSYWALAHPPGKPDFHHPDCFALTLPAPDAA